MHHNLDIIIYATGYSLDGNWSQLGGKDDTGMNSLNAKKLIILVRSFYGSFYESTPNFFTFYGPHTNLGHFSIIYMIECQMQLLINVLKIYFESNANGCQGRVRSINHRLSGAIFNHPRENVALKSSNQHCVENPNKLNPNRLLHS